MTSQYRCDQKNCKRNCKLIADDGWSGYKNGTQYPVPMTVCPGYGNDVNWIKEQSDFQSEREKVLKKLIADINRVSLTGFTKYTYRKWILEELRKGGE